MWAMWDVGGGILAAHSNRPHVVSRRPVVRSKSHAKTSWQRRRPPERGHPGHDRRLRTFDATKAIPSGMRPIERVLAALLSGSNFQLIPLCTFSHFCYTKRASPAKSSNFTRPNTIGCVEIWPVWRDYRVTASNTRSSRRTAKKRIPTPRSSNACVKLIK